jgi:hypothetical protein
MTRTTDPSRRRPLRSRGQTEDVTLARGERLEGLRSDATHRLAAVPPCLDESGGAEPADVPADQRLRQPHVLDQLAHARGAVGEAADDAEAVDIGERLVDRAELAKLGGGVRDGGEGGPDPGA